MTLYPIICCTCVAECMKMRCVHDTLSHHLLYMCCRVHENEECTYDTLSHHLLYMCCRVHENEECTYDTLSHHLLYMCCRVHENEECTYLFSLLKTFFTVLFCIMQPFTRQFIQSSKEAILVLHNAAVILQCKTFYPVF